MIETIDGVALKDVEVKMPLDEFYCSAGPTASSLQGAAKGIG